MKIRTLILLVLSLLACGRATADQSSIHIPESSQEARQRSGLTTSNYDDSVKLFINPALKSIAGNFSGSSCSNITSPMPWQWCVDTAGRKVYMYGFNTGTSAWGWALILTLNADGSASQGTIAPGSVTASMLDVGAAQGNLGFPPLRPGNNLSDVSSVTTARSNLGLGSLALLNSLAFSSLTGTIVNSMVDASAAISASKCSYTAAGTGAIARACDKRFGDIVSMLDYMKGDGVTDDSAALVNAYNATPSGGTLDSGCAVYKVSGSGLAVLTITKPITIISRPCASWIGTLGTTTDLFRVRPGSGALIRGVNFIGLTNIGITGGQTWIHLDTNASNTSELAEVTIKGVNLPPPGSGSPIWIDNPVTNTNGGTFNFLLGENSVLSSGAGGAGVLLSNAGDTLRFRDSIFTGAGFSIYGSQITNGGQIIEEGNNHSSKGGIVLQTAVKPILRESEVELAGGTAINGYQIGCLACVGGTINHQVQNFSATIGENIFIGSASSDVVIDSSALFTDGSAPGAITIQSGATRTKIGCLTSFSGFSTNIVTTGSGYGTTQSCVPLPWTPTVSGTTVAGAQAYAFNTGYYTSHGGNVVAKFTLQTSSNTGTGNIRLNSLPVTSNASIADGTCTFSQYSLGGTPIANTYGLTASVNTGDTTAQFYVNGNAAATVLTMAAAGGAFLAQGECRYHL